MEWSQLLQVIFSFIFVVALMLGIGALIKKFGLEKKWNMVKSTSGLLKVVDSMFLDAKRRVVVISMEEKRYVVLLDGERAQLIDTLEK
jgi:flagellar biogenesis protein FliO